MLHRVVANLLGVVLLAAAALKLYGLNVAPFAQHGWLMSGPVQLGSILWEIALGVWLISGRGQVAAWVAAVFTFLLFAGLSLYHGLVGQASCGCFGSIKASPWHAFIVDVTALMLLWGGRPDFCCLSALKRAELRVAILRWIGFSAGAAAAGAGLIWLGILAFGSADAALAHLRGERLTIRPGFVDMGHGHPGQTLEATVEVVNRTDRPVRLIGGTSDCSCVTTADLPLTLLPGETRQLSVQVRLYEPGLFTRRASLWTNHDQARKVGFVLTGRVDRLAQKSGEVTKE